MAITRVTIEVSMEGESTATLSFGPDECEEIELSTPRDIIELQVEGQEGAVHRGLGKAHLNLVAHFREGHVPTWS